MSRFIDISFLGDKKLSRKFKKLERRVQSKIMRDATKKAIRPVWLTAISRAPYKTGRTLRNIKIATDRRRDQTGAVVQTGTRRQMGISADADFYYPAAHEYGTRNMPARPFLRSALKDRRAQALGILRSEIKKMMKVT